MFFHHLNPIASQRNEEAPERRVLLIPGESSKKEDHFLDLKVNILKKDSSWINSLN